MIWRNIKLPTVSAFRNLVNTQYEQEVLVAQSDGKFHKEKRLVAKAYLTYEEVLKQIERDFCREEVDMLIARLSAKNYLYREQQIKHYERLEKLRQKRAKERAAKERVITVDDVLKANKIDPNNKKPHLWNEKV